jgi:hypothetical protein
MRSAFLLFALVCLPPALLAQAAAPGVPASGLEAVGADALDGGIPAPPWAAPTAAARADSAEVPPVVTLPDRRWAPALVDLTIANLVPWSYNRFVSGQAWAEVGPETWSRNLRAGAEWDDNSFYANHFDHPYHGAMYYAAGRANGFSFGASSAFTLVGSALWEFLGETNVPSGNDLLTTTLGGIIVGEAGWRASQLIIDEGARGLDRAWREVVVLGMNPGYGIHRLVRGRMWTVREDSVRLAPRYETTVDAGYRSRRGQGAGDGAVDQGTFRVALRYGDPFAYRRLGAFDAFEARVEVGSGQPRALGELGANGILLGRRATPGLVVGAVADYVLLAAPQYEFSTIAFGATARTRTAAAGRWRAGAALDVMVAPVAAATSAYARPWLDRPYDITWGPGVRASAYLDRGPVRARASWTGWALYPLSAAADRHVVQLVSLEARVPLAGQYAVGAGYDLYHQSADFGRGVGRATSQYPDVRLFVARAGGLWR